MDHKLQETIAHLASHCKSTPLGIGMDVAYSNTCGSQDTAFACRSLWTEHIEKVSAR